MKKIIVKDSSYPDKAKLIDILIYPHPVLKQIAQKVETFDRNLKEFCNNMVKTMYHAPGIGLAAPQVGVSKRIFVCDVNYERVKIGEDDPDKDEEQEDLIYELKDLNPKIYINPEIVVTEGDTTYEEGCLSLPGIFDVVKRHKKIELKYQDLDGKNHYESVDDLHSICAQHEIDHLDGIMFIERLSSLKFQFYKKKFANKK